MGEFKLHHLIKELLDVVGSKEKEEFVEVVEFLQNNISKNTANPQNRSNVLHQIQQLSQQAPNPQNFLAKYEEIKQKNVDSLNSYIQLLNCISQDQTVKDFLAATAKKNPGTHNDTTSSGGNSQLFTSTPLTHDELQEVKSRLKQAIIKQSPSREVERSKILNKSSVIPTANTPSITSWVQKRPSMSWDFSCNAVANIRSAPISNIPPDSQENILLEDLLNILIGVPSCYIRPVRLVDPYAPRDFIIDESIEMTLKELVKQILPLASYFSVVQRFTEEKMRFEFGQVNNALAECMSTFIVDYTLFITQLETEAHMGNLNLQKMWYYIQKNLHAMSIMSNIATTISKSDAKGGKVLSLLHEHITGFIGDAKAQEVCLHFIQAACVPYMKILGMWIYKGIIADPFREFLIEDNEIVQKEDMLVDYSADYWDKKYTIRRESIPKFLEPVADIILCAGKYLNVIRQCGKPINNKVHVIEYKIDEKHYIEAIKKAYKFASQTLLDVLFKEHDLMGRLKSVKHYFLLDQGDFIVTFLTLCEKELNKDVADAIQVRIDSLLDLALRLSSSNSDPYKDDLRTELLPYNLQCQMFRILSILTEDEEEYANIEQKSLSVIESFAFSYEVSWPLSLILNRRSLACYQMIFRHLFYCKHIERMICHVWRANKVVKGFPRSVACQYHAAFALRQRMLHCIQNLEYHMMVEVIEPHWCTLMQAMAKVGNVDGILANHTDFLNACLKDCMLTIPRLLSTVNNILQICARFCRFMQTEFPNTVNNTEDGQKMASFAESVSQLDFEFSEYLKDLLDQISNLNKDTSEHDRLYNLLYRLDFNSYYSCQFESGGFNKNKTG
ncbi:gamma-tubulin complex component 2 isoform X2 [Agrilus planipennis]|uniref:Gamma-tubulin complex component n=1 Tax=Agrilus planipennis TaxID=224129 RepID=A0A1W4XKP3_AGRPL|nr:gamma-tubulin complex component 2 isoform X2 [Agrilus planipennis]